MAYIPPHKRQHSKDPEKPLPKPEKLETTFNRSLNLNSTKPKDPRIKNLVYAQHAMHRWTAIDKNGVNQIPSTVRLEPAPFEFIGRKIGEEPFVLVNSHACKEEDDASSKNACECDILCLEKDLMSSLEILRKEMEDVKATLVARFGKILFNRRPNVDIESVRANPLSVATLRKFRKIFYTNVPASYKEKVINEVVPKIGVDFEQEKIIYRVILSDRERPESTTISCKCNLTEDKKLHLYQVELNPVRRMIVDVSCLDKNVDLRLALSTKNILSTRKNTIALTEDEMQSIRKLIDSAIVDHEVKGGLRWPIGKERSGDRFTIVRAWHTISKIYDCPSMRLKVKDVDRFNFETSDGERTTEITLKFKTVLPQLQGGTTETEMGIKEFKDTIQLIWDNLLCSGSFFT